MSEIYIPAEMVQAGVEALEEAQRKKFSKFEIALVVYLSMRAVEEMLEFPEETIH